MQTNSFKYIIITPAKNEADFITGTIESVIHQSIKPLLWIIVDDGSTDNTSEIVNRYQKNYSLLSW